MSYRLKSFYPLFFAFTMSLPVMAAADQLTIGAKMPLSDVKMKNIDSSMISLDDARGSKGTLVIFTCNHCPYVKAWESRTVALANAAVKQGFGVIAINPNDPSEYKDDDFASNQERAKNAGMMYPYVVDAGSRLARAFGATRTPEFFLFNNAGSLIYHGALDDNAQDAKSVSNEYLRQAIAAYTAGGTIQPAITKSVGCTIKFYK